MNLQGLSTEELADLERSKKKINNCSSSPESSDTPTNDDDIPMDIEHPNSSKLCYKEKLVSSQSPSISVHFSFSEDSFLSEDREYF